MNQLLLNLLPQDMYEMQDEPIDAQLWWTNAYLMLFVIAARATWSWVMNGWVDFILFTTVALIFWGLAWLSAFK